MLFYSPYYTLHAVKYYGGKTKKLSGLSRPQQYYRALSASMGHGLCPYSWYEFHLYQHEKTDMAMWGNIYSQELSAFHALRNCKRPLYKEHVALLADKAHFEQYLTENGVQSAEILRKVLKGDVNFRTYLEELIHDHGSVFCKQRSGSGGLGAFTAFFENGHLRVKSLKESSPAAAETNGYLVDSIQKNDYLIQPAYKNHKHLRLHERPTMTTRIITAYQEKNINPELAIFYWPIMDRDRIKFHYPIAIDPHSGKFDPSYPAWPRDGLDAEDLEQVESFVEAFKNEPLPLWSEALQQAQAAHKLFSGVDQVAWDIILSEDQAVLLEGNSCWGGLDVCQWFGYDIKRFMR